MARKFLRRQPTSRWHELAPEERAEGLRLVLEPSARIEERVLTADGEPVAGALVVGRSEPADPVDRHELDQRYG